MPNEGLFRQATPADVEAIVEIALLAWEPIWETRREAVGDEFFRRYFGDCCGRKAESLRRAVAERPECAYVTEMEGKVVGFTTFRVDAERSVGEIGNNGVHPDWQGRGIGTRQHRAVLDIFRQKGLDYATVNTGLDKGHAPARATYQKVGFRPMSEWVTYFTEL